MSGGRFIALIPLNTAEGWKQPGELIASAASWGDIQKQAEVNAGHVYDLTRKYRLKLMNLSSQRREDDLLGALPKHGKRVVPHSDHPDHFDIIDIDADGVAIEKQPPSDAQLPGAGATDAVETGAETVGASSAPVNKLKTSKQTK